MKPQRLLPAALMLTLLPLAAACGGVPKTTLDGRDELPATKDGLILTIADTGTGPQFLLVDPDGGDMKTWQLADDRGIQEAGKACLGQWNHGSWLSEDDAIFYNGQLGCKEGPWILEDDGGVKRFKDLPDDLDAADLAGALPSPDGGRIAFIQAYKDEDDEDREDVAVLDVAGETWEQLSELPPGKVLAMDWSPAGNALAILHWDADEEELNIRRVDLDGNETLLLGGDKDADLDLDEDQIRPMLKWSPDGATLAFVHEDEPESLQLLDLATGEVEERELPTDADDMKDKGGDADESGIHAFAWSPDSDDLVLATGGRCFKRLTEAGRVAECTDLLYTAPATGDDDPEMLTDVLQSGTVDLNWIR
jgi:dipeptidyl aminopeptidase/acylaminoacyl peptidase